MNALEVENVFFSYNATSVLEDVSFSVSPGEYVAIFGPNGGGKTTLLYLLMGFLKLNRGKISIFGKSPKEGREMIGWVPQNFHYDRDFPISVEEVVLGGRLAKLSWSGRFTKKDYTICIESLEKVGMEKSLHLPFASLSGGQAQRVLIARALASQPSILLLDEPTASVDFTAQNEIYALFKALKGEMALVMVTHDLNSAVEHVDRLFCVQRTLTSMSPEKVCEHFAVGLYHSPLKKEEE